MVVVGREPEMAVRILAHRDEAVVRQRREIPRRGAEILERIAVETTHPIPRADPHEAPRIGMDVGNPVVREAVQRGVGPEKALRRRRRKEWRKQASEAQQKGQQKSVHGRRFVVGSASESGGRPALRRVSGSNGRRKLGSAPPFRSFVWSGGAPVWVNIRNFSVQRAKAATIPRASRAERRCAQPARGPAAPGPSEAYSP